MTSSRFCMGMTCVLAGLLPALARAQNPSPPPAAVAQPELSSRQLQVYRDYERFEKSLFEVAEQLRVNDPDQATLLYQARGKSQEQNILNEMTLIAELLRTQNAAGAATSPRYGPAAERQQELLVRMKDILKLLQSLDDRERIGAEIKRIEALLKDTNRIIARQKDVRADTERGKPSEQLTPAEQKVADEADQLGKKIDQQDAERKREREERSPKPPPGPGAQGQPQQGQPQQGQPNQGQPNEGQPNQGQPNQGQPNQGQPQQGQPQQGQPNQGQPNEGQPQPPKPADQQTPGREQLEQARRAMQQALEQLRQNQPKDALEKQENAVNRLEEMKAELEKILRQLRQDERESYLTQLEARFQNMLKRQQSVNTTTTRLSKIPEADRPQQNYAAQVDTVRKDQEDNALEAEKALRLLKDEGSSVAFPEAVEQMHKNMLLVRDRLSRHDTGSTTQTIESLIAQTLEEMIAALRQEIEKARHDADASKGKPGGGGQPADRGLVAQIAELKLIRSLQVQINVLTTTIGTELDGQPAADAAQQEILRELSSRQDRLQQATYDLSVGKNK